MSRGHLACPVKLFLGEIFFGRFPRRYSTISRQSLSISTIRGGPQEVNSAPFGPRQWGGQETALQGLPDTLGARPAKIRVASDLLAVSRVLHWNRLLNHDRPAVEPLVDQVDRAAGDSPRHAPRPGACASRPGKDGKRLGWTLRIRRADTRARSASRAVACSRPDKPTPRLPSRRARRAASRSCSWTDRLNPRWGKIDGSQARAPEPWQSPVPPARLLADHEDDFRAGDLPAFESLLGEPGSCCRRPESKHRDPAPVELKPVSSPRPQADVLRKVVDHAPGPLSGTVPIGVGLLASDRPRHFETLRPVDSGSITRTMPIPMLKTRNISSVSTPRHAPARASEELWNLPTTDPNRRLDSSIGRHPWQIVRKTPARDVGHGVQTRDGTASGSKRRQVGEMGLEQKAPDHGPCDLRNPAP